ncbi:hypothetical protein BH683_011355 [Williamsia sp. 1138]|uniref:hypothetical protein n=1 Tax=Williamsia sp. 1138 TaxID=1903117 RepID=UPI000A0F7E32|nr:hypothetical protein [Williamsia sp. 1138]OZG28999.1 hypothetical protein BH683_011355 [Williamsia sp. 1138]
MTSPDDQLDSIFSQIGAEDQVDPAVFDQSLEAAFDHAGSGLDELIPDETDDVTDTDGDGDDLLGGDFEDAFDTSGDIDGGDTETDESDTTDFTDHTGDDYAPADDLDI